MSFSVFLGASATAREPGTPPTYPLVELREIDPDGLYLRLFHGRHSPDEQLDDWGFDGPYIGPVLLGLTYGTVKVHHPEHHGFEELPFKDGLIHLDGAYYGDMDVIAGRDLLAPRRHNLPAGLPLLTWEQYNQLARQAKGHLPRTATCPWHLAASTTPNSVIA